MTTPMPVHPDFPALWELGANDREASLKIGVSEGVIRRWREELGLPRRYGKLPTPPVRRGYRSRRKAGWTDEEIAAHFSVTERTALRWRRQIEFEDKLPKNAVHGSVNTYSKGCRCDRCISGYRADQQDQKSMRMLRTMANGGIAPVESHNARTFTNWGCTCDTCREAKKAENARYKASLKRKREKQSAS